MLNPTLTSLTAPDTAYAEEALLPKPAWPSTRAIVLADRAAVFAHPAAGTLMAAGGWHGDIPGGAVAGAGHPRAPARISLEALFGFETRL